MKWRRVAKVVILSTLINSIHIQCGEEEALLLDPDIAGRVKRSGGGDGGYDVWYECQTSNTGNIIIFDYRDHIKLFGTKLLIFRDITEVSNYPIFTNTTLSNILMYLQAFSAFWQFPSS